MKSEVYPMPIANYLKGERLKNLAMASLRRILVGDKSGMISYPAERWLILRKYVKRIGIAKFHWCLYAFEYELTNEGMAFYKNNCR